MPGAAPPVSRFRRFSPLFAMRRSWVRIPSRPPNLKKMVPCESRMFCPAFGVMSPQVVTSLLKLRESDLSRVIGRGLCRWASRDLLLSISPAGHVLGRFVNRLHAHYLVRTHFLIALRKLDHHAIPFQLEDNLMTDEQNHRVLHVHGSDAIVHIVRSYQVLRAELFGRMHIGNAY